MKGNNLNGYIVRFQHLAVEAGFDNNTSATVSLFASPKVTNPGIAGWLLEGHLNIALFYIIR